MVALCPTAQHLNREMPDLNGGMPDMLRQRTPNPGLTCHGYGYCAVRLSTRDSPEHLETVVIVLGVVLLIVGFLTKVAIIWTLGIIAVVVGAVLAILGTAGREIGGRRHWY